MKLELIVKHEQALKALTQVKLTDAQLTWNLADALEEVEKAIKRFHDKRNELLQKYGTPSEKDPNQFEIQDPVKFDKEVNELLGVEVKLTFPKIDLKALNGASVCPADLLGWKALKIVTKP